jgi:hypothetical protein
MRLMERSEVHTGLVPWRIFFKNTVLFTLRTYRLNKPITNTPTPPRRNIAPRTVPTYVLGASRNIPTTTPKIPAIINPILTMFYPSTTTMFMIIKMLYMRFTSAFCWRISMDGTYMFNVPLSDAKYPALYENVYAKYERPLDKPFFWKNGRLY